MAIPDSDPRAQDLDAAFAAAMDAPARPRAEAKAPPELDHDAPHGRDESGQPLAPYGLTKDGKPKRSAGGRPAKNDPDRPRTGTVTELRPGDGDDDKKPKAKPGPHDYSEALDSAATAAWFGLSAVSKVSGKIPVVSKLLPGEKLAAQAFILHETKDNLIGAVNLAAQHDARAAAFAAKFEGDGSGLWALTAMFMVMPVISLSAAVWQGEKAVKEAELPTLAEMGKHNDGLMDEMVARIKAQITAQMEAAQPPGAGPETADAGAS